MAVALAFSAVEASAVGRGGVAGLKANPEEEAICCCSAAVEVEGDLGAESALTKRRSLSIVRILSERR